MRTPFSGFAGFVVVGAMAAGLFAALASVGACAEREVYIYSAARYDEAADCIAPYSSLETIEGEGASVRCSPKCISFEDELYVSTVCPPVPTGAELVPPEDPTCAAALRAFNRDGGACSEGAGSGASEDAGGSEAGPEKPEPDAGEPIRDAGPG